MLFVSHSALLFVSHPHIRTSAKLVLSQTALLFVSQTAKLVPSTSVKFVLVLRHYTTSLFVSQIPSPTRPKVNLDEHCSLGVTPSRAATAGN